MFFIFDLLLHGLGCFFHSTKSEYTNLFTTGLARLATQGMDFFTHTLVDQVSVPSEGLGNHRIFSYIFVIPCLVYDDNAILVLDGLIPPNMTDVRR